MVGENDNQQDLDDSDLSSWHDQLNTILGAEKLAVLLKIFGLHGLRISEALKSGLSILAAVLPVLARGGQLVLREPDGAERIYVLPSL